ncbi:hypothetical protein [Brevibacterium sp. CFH 10365]|uniref:hypothetical protein n=1 Tax=Brevibacterium sp. CFH 10365 TaxID=2585207 RepID=UPI00126678BC|nr:hypothetical protein [Brevibacterium sp. CFH 10365]
MIFSRKKTEPAPAKKAESGIEYDKDTGLPVLPDGYTWKVEKATYTKYDRWGYDYLTRGYQVLIVNKKKSTRYHRSFSELTDANVKRVACAVYRDFQRDLELKDAEARLLGEYPPKSLGGI